jgi:hypothetical protein
MKIKSNPAKVIDLATARKPLDPLTIKQQDYRACQHKHLWIDRTLRTVECEDCGILLDPIEVLIDISRECGSWKVPQLEEEIAELQKQLAMKDWLGRKAMMTEEERKMSQTALLELHAKQGHPLDRIEITRTELRCVCGLRSQRRYARAFEAEVLRAQMKHVKK